MKKLLFCGLLVLTFAISGCVMRVIPREMDRVDQELTGNRGVIMGSRESLSESKKDKRETRTIYDVEIEFSSPVDAERVRKQETATQDTYGNRGYLQRKTVSEKDMRPVEEKRSSSNMLLKPSQPQVIYQKTMAPEVKYKKEKGEGTLTEAGKNEVKTYIVQRGDTLQKISDKMYGTTKKWKTIYEANKNILKSPDKIRSGQKLIIPVE